MSVLDDLLKKHRQRLIKREELAIRELLQAYSLIEKDLKRSIRELQQKVLDAQAASEEISRSWFLKQQRLQSLIDQVKSQVEKFGGTAAQITTREQRAAIQIAVEQASETLQLTTGSPGGQIGSLLTPRAVENAVGMMGDGSPILEYYRENLAPKVAEMIRTEVIKAAALGTDFRTIANRLLATGQITKSRALTVARTEVNRVRRETTLQTFRDRPDLIIGWEWVASKSPRTCVVCLALDGRIFKLKDEFPQHINCRCTLIAVIAGVPRPKRTLGKDWFDAQSDEVKEKILGKDGLAAYKEGLVELKDFIGWKNDKQFGRSVYTRPLSQVLAEKPVAERIIRTPKDITVNFEYGTRERLEELVGTLSDNQIGGLVGALDGAVVEVDDYGHGLSFSIRHPMIAEQRRTLDIDYAGRVYMHNDIFRTSRTAPSGIGLKSFATQALHAERFGVEYIETEAVGSFASSQESYRWNGYYTWARFGYNARLYEDDWENFPVTYKGIKDLNDLFLQQNGKLVWLYFGGSKDMIFDLDRSERSFRILEAYLHEKGFTVRFK